MEARIEEWLDLHFLDDPYPMDIVTYIDQNNPLPSKIEQFLSPDSIESQQDITLDTQDSQAQLEPHPTDPIVFQDEVLSECEELLQCLDNLSEYSIHISEMSFPDSLPDLGCIELHSDNNNNLPDSTI